MTVGLGWLLFLNSNIPETDPAIRPYIGPNGASSLLFHVHPKNLLIDSCLSSYPDSKDIAVPRQPEYWF